MEPLQVTSCLFATIVFHAYSLHCTVHHHVFLLVTVFSILFHTTHERTIAILDKFTAHLAFLIILLDLPLAIDTGNAWITLFPVGVLVLWCTEFVYTERRTELHVCLHLVSIVGVHFFLHRLHGTHTTVVTPQPALDR